MKIGLLHIAILQIYVKGLKNNDKLEIYTKMYILVIVVGFAVVMGLLYSMIQAVYWLFSFVGKGC